MKVKLISDNNSYNFEEKINNFLSKHNVSMVNIKYSTTCISKPQSIGNTVENVNTVIYTALILYEELIDYENIL